MKKIIGVILVVCVFVIYLSGCKGKGDELLIVYNGNNHIIQASELSEPTNDEWYEMNHHCDANFDGYKVKIEDNNLVVELNSRENEDDPIIHKVAGGQFEGMCYGEFGGYLKFNNYQILDTNINFIFEMDDKIYALGGLAHMITDEGSMYRLERENDKWIATNVLDIGSDPEAICIDDSKLYIVASSRVAMIENEEIIEVMVEDAFWSGLYPNSVVLHDEKLIIGMRGCICTVDIKTNELKWYPLDFD